MTDVEVLLRQHAQSDNLDCKTTRFDWWLAYTLSLYGQLERLSVRIADLERKTEMEDRGISGERLDELMS